MRRTEKDYGLPPLTFKEAARLLGVDEHEIEVFVMKTIRPGSDRWSRWEGGAPLPEVILRLYLAWLRGLQPAPMTPELPAPAEAVPKPPTAKRASGKRG